MRQPIERSAISRYPVPRPEQLPDDIRARMLEVQEKAGFIPNVFLTLAHRPDEFLAQLFRPGYTRPLVARAAPMGC